jgi:glutathione S-transferase
MMLTLYDYLPSQNAWKIRLLLNHLDIPYRTEIVRIFEGEGQRAGFLAVSPTGAVPALRLPDGRAPALVERLRVVAHKTLAILERELAPRPFIAGATYTIADMSLFAYIHRADEAGLALADHPHVVRWIERVRAQPGFLGTAHPYSIDPFSGGELP